VDRAELVAGDVLVDGGFLSMRDRMDWRTTRTMLSPPQLKGMSLEQFRAGMRTFTRGAVELTPEVEAVFLSLMRVDRECNIDPRLSRANHLRILHALWEQDAPALLRRVQQPTLVLAVRSAPGEADSAGFMEEKERAAEVVKAIDGAVRFEWIDGIHDVPIQRPDAVAERIQRFVQEVVG
jgi:pimeloyl-ACP methyl ester carboxylesterase